MGRKDTSMFKKPVFMHDNMQSIIPDITTVKGMHQMEERPDFPMQKPLPVTASGKKYAVLPNLGEAQSKCKNNAALSRPNPCISPDIFPQPEIKKPRVPLACLDIQSIKVKMTKAEKREKKAKKKRSKPAPKQMTINITESQNEQRNENLPLIHIPHPPEYPIDMTKPRRIVRFKQPVFCQEVTLEQFASMVTAGSFEKYGGLPTTSGEEYLDPEQVYQAVQPDPYVGYIHPVDTLPGVTGQQYEDVQPDPFGGYAHPVDALPGFMDQQMQPNSVYGHTHPVDALPGIMDQQMQPNSAYGYTHPVDTLPGIMDQQMQPYSAYGHTHPVDTLPGIMDQQMQPHSVYDHTPPVDTIPGILNQQIQPHLVYDHTHPVDTFPGINDMPPAENGYYGQSLPFFGLGSLKQDFYGEGSAGYPGITCTGQQRSYGEGSKPSRRGKLAPIPSVTSKHKDIKIHNKPMKSTSKQRSRNTNQKLISINSSVSI